MKNYKKYFHLDAEPKDVYNALTNKLMLEIWTGEEAEMEEVPGTEFSLWDGSICGKNLEFVKDEKICSGMVCLERTQEPSIVTIKLHSDKGGTSMEVKHTNIPNESIQ